MIWWLRCWTDIDLTSGQTLSFLSSTIVAAPLVPLWAAGTWPVAVGQSVALLLLCDHHHCQHDRSLCVWHYLHHRSRIFQKAPPPREQSRLLARRRLWRRTLGVFKCLTGSRVRYWVWHSLTVYTLIYRLYFVEEVLQIDTLIIQIRLWPHPLISAKECE